MAEYSANAVQTVAVGDPIVFTETPIPCKRGFIRHRDGTGVFNLSGYTPNRNCGCQNADYKIDFGANIAIESGKTSGPISVAFAIDGSIIPSTTMIVTPGAVGNYFNVSCAIDIDVWRNCCETFSIVNTSNVPINVQNANVIFDRADLLVSY